MDTTSYVTPFVMSVQNVFETMLQLPVQLGTPEMKRSCEPCHDVSGIIAMSGDMEGSIVLSFPTATAERVVALFVGEELTSTHEDFADAVGELVNMVSGGAKARFEGKQVSISCPSVVIGPGHQVHSRKDVVTVMIPCSSDVGDFAVEVSLLQSSLAAPAGDAAAASA